MQPFPVPANQYLSETPGLVDYQQLCENTAGGCSMFSTELTGQTMPQWVPYAPPETLPFKGFDWDTAK